MNEKKLKQLIDLFEESRLDELEIERTFWGGTRVRLGKRRPEAPPAPAAPPAVPEPLPQPRAAAAPPAPAEPATEVPVEAPAAAAEPGIHTVSSPMVGTFYRAASPEEDPFVTEGDQVELGQTICIVEAMKIMNELEAAVRGEVVEILASEGAPVEYNQPLMRIRPS